MPSQLEILRGMRSEAQEHLEDVREHHLDRWKGESEGHWQHRRDLHAERKKNAAKIYKGLDARVEMAAKRREKRRKENKADSNPYDAHGGGIVNFDAKTCVEWIAHDLYEAREHGWNGYLVSGYRTPAYSISLCMSMCGAPSCSGTCAGAASNHAKSGDGQGAVDLSDYITAERVFHDIGSRLWNNLSRDLVHFSSSGV